MGRFKTERDHDYYKTVDDAINAYTWAAIVKIQERRVIDEVLGPIGQGKEAKIVLAKRQNVYVVLKIFYPTSNRFARRHSYILGDPRFRRLKISDQLHLVETWCRKEFGNLARAHAAGVKTPKPFDFYRNVLVMEFIGVGTTPAPRLIDVGLENLGEQTFYQVLRDLEKTYIVAGLVHSDLSPFNVLYDGESTWIIDWGSAVRRGHPKELEYLKRDVEKIVQFFKKPIDPTQLFQKIVERGRERHIEVDDEGWVLVRGRRITEDI